VLESVHPVAKAVPQKGGKKGCCRQDHDSAASGEAKIYPPKAQMTSYRGARGGAQRARDWPDRKLQNRDLGI
jgi:hypothetical protein